MNRVLIVSVVLLAFLVSFGMVGCTSQEETVEEEMAMTSTVLVKHDVADYAAWRLVYDADAARRTEAGLKEIGVYQDADNANSLLLAWETDNVEAFNMMLADSTLKEKMQEAGVTSAPETWIAGDLREGAGITFLKHQVADYDAWRPAYDADAARRAEAGLEEMGVYRDATDANIILVVWGTKDGNAVKGMLESEDLAAKMKEAGVMSKPETWMADANAEMTATKE